MDVFLGQLMLVPYTFAPKNWAFCQGQLLSVSQNSALFSLLGTYYGGDGRSTFALPNLQGNMPIGIGAGPGLPTYTIGEIAGETQVTLLSPQMPSHTHIQMAGNQGPTAQTPIGNAFAQGGGRRPFEYYAPTPSTSSQMAQMNSMEIGVGGGSQPHPNMQPFLALNYIIALTGVYPTRP